MAEDAQKRKERRVVDLGPEGLEDLRVKLSAVIEVNERYMLEVMLPNISIPSLGNMRTVPMLTMRKMGGFGKLVVMVMVMVMVLCRIKIWR